MAARLSRNMKAVKRIVELEREVVVTRVLVFSSRVSRPGCVRGRYSQIKERAGRKRRQGGIGRAIVMKYRDSAGKDPRIVRIDCELMIQHNSYCASEASFRREKDAYGLQPAGRHLPRGRTL